MNKVFPIAILSLALFGCGEESFDYEGKYFATEGDECIPDTTSKNKDVVFFEIIAQGKGDAISYTAKIPMGAAWGLPTKSEGLSSPTEKEKLNFSFSKEGKSGLFSGKPSIEMSITVKPHESKAGHVLLTSWDATVSQNGMVKQISPLKEMQKSKGKYQVSTKGLCLLKQVSEA